jgi:hypothetical protein
MKNKKYLLIVIMFLSCLAFVTSNPTCPTGYTMAPTSTGTSRNCTSCHGDYSLNTAGGGIVLTGLPSSFTAGTAYPFSIKINHATADRKIWGYAIKAVDTTTNVVVGTWTTTNANSSIKSTAGSATYELSHASAAVTTVANTYTYTGLTWTAPATAPSKVKFYAVAVAGNNNGNEALDYVYTSTFVSNRAATTTPPSAPTISVIQPTCVFGGTIDITSDPTGLQFSIDGVNYSLATSFVGLVGGTYNVTAKNANGTSTATVATVNAQPTVPVGSTIFGNRTITTCDTLQTYYVGAVAGTTCYWSVTGTGNYIKTGQGNVTAQIVMKANGIVYCSQSNTCGVGPTTSLSVSRSTTPTPTAITANTGNLNPCVGSVVLYTITSPTPTSTQLAPAKFRWTTPKYTTIILSSADSSYINLRFDAGYVGGSLSAKGQASCGIQGAVKTITFTPVTPLNIITNTGVYNACINDNVSFAVIPAVAVSTTANATVYRWTRPTGITILSANIDSSVIVTKISTGYVGGSIKVQGSTACGIMSVAKSVTLTHTGCATGLRMAEEDILSEDVIPDNVKLFPNPNNGTFNLMINTNNKENIPVDISITNMYGVVVGKYRATNNLGTIYKNISNNNLPVGMYNVIYTIGNKSKAVQMVIIK